MADFLGKFVVRIEPSGRVGLPRQLAYIFGELGYLRTCLDGLYHYVELFSEQGIKTLSDFYKGKSLPRDDEDKWNFREFSEDLVPVTIQGKSRLTLPKEIREHGGFSPEKELLMIGGGECVELWDPETYNAARAARNQE